MKIIHLSTECYPAAKVGGLGDVVGALPKYQNKSGHSASVVMPYYHTKWLLEQSKEVVFSGSFDFGAVNYGFEVLKLEVYNQLGFDLYAVSIPGLFDRADVYIDPITKTGFADEIDRNIGFQVAAVQYINALAELPDVVHCHDHHTGLVPFFMSRSIAFERLALIPTVLTIHNAHYQGNFSWSYYHYLPEFNPQFSGLLEWNQQINSLASAIKCAWAVTTVSNGYLDELQVHGWGLEWLFKNELSKSKGVVNGIDALEWNPQTDGYLNHHLQSSVEDFKQAGKHEICAAYGLDASLPLFVFIGRLVPDKGVDLIVDVLHNNFTTNYPSNILVLGSGNPDIAQSLLEAKEKYPNNIAVEIKYDEGLAHRLYASADFLLMPSRFEPCGLNQLYAMHYGTIPVVHTVGGLKETVPDVVQNNGRGFCFGAPYAHLLEQAMARAVAFFKDKQAMQNLQNQLMQIDFSWEHATNQYTQTYNYVLSKNKEA